MEHIIAKALMSVVRLKVEKFIQWLIEAEEEDSDE